MSETFFEEFLHGATLRRAKEELARVGVVKVNGSSWRIACGLAGPGDKVGLSGKVSGMFGIMAIEIANPIGGRSITAPSQIVVMA